MLENDDLLIQCVQRVGSVGLIIKHEKLKNENPKTWAFQRALFISDMDDRPYKLRGDNLRKAQVLGLPEEYNRLALMLVSVLHLSHWRLDEGGDPSWNDKYYQT
ncbi:MAG: hypothetical protein IK087_05595 [Lachnospiraceae bacterium]|nr:hypothetical protein [Lachnospiraceae bacterium]